MKRLTSFVALLLCSLLTFAQFSGSGSGTENDPYLILNPIQLNQMRNFLNQSGVYFKLMADIDLTDFLEDENPSQGWQPVGNNSSSTSYFKGTLDGNGKTISGLWISRSNADYVGLFGYCSGATIKNLIIRDAHIKGKNRIGVISGYCSGSNISSCVLSGKIEGSSYVGGCTGDGGNFNDISSTVEVKGGNYTGGIVGNSISGISYCFVNSTITGGQYTGGIVGYNDDGSTAYCGFVGSLTGTSYVGGICGRDYSQDTMSKCYVVASITGSGENTGGLIGHSSCSVEDCYFSGRVSGQKYTGGLIGYRNNWTVKRCYSHGSITGTSYVGGLCGYIVDYDMIESNIIIASSIKATEGGVGRLYGYNKYASGIGIGGMGTNKENKSYNRTIVISQGVAQDITDDLQNGTGVSATTLKLKATYVAMGWDFNDVWAIQETECYPYMQRQTAPPVITSNVVSNATVISGKCIDGGTVTLEIDGLKQQIVSTGNQFSFTVSPLQAGHEVRISAKANDKEPSYYTTETVSYLGRGTETDPYQIYTAADLTGVYRKGYFKLMNDIDLTDYINQFSPTEGWESIGREGSETIHFDGDGHKITGLWCNSTRDNTGLFSCFANGEIKNLTVETANGKQVKGGANTGILIGKMMNGTIENCCVMGKIADGTPVGGMVGLFDGGSISHCQASVTINTTGATSYVGGLVGEIASGEMDQCVTTGTLTGTGTESYVGGLIGKNSGTVTNCHSDAIISSSYNAAGLVAYNYGVVNKCYATGNLYSNNYAAGIIGYNDGANAVVQNCAAMNNKIEIVYESQQVQQGGGYGQRIIGGIKNSAPAPEMNNYALSTMQVSLNDVPQVVYDDIMNGVAKTEAELKTASTYQGLGWDFTDVWSIEEGANYPKLSWESTTPIPSDVVTGDANGDNTVNVTDYLTIANYILGLNVENFNETAADVNEDNDVNVSDYVGVANIILYGNYQGIISNNTQEYDWTYDEDNPLITEVEQFSSPMSDSGEGNFYSLLDRLSECPEDQHPGNDYWHSDWHNGSQTPGTHYFQVEILDPENLPDEIVFVFTRRPADNDHTTEWSVRGTNDPDASKEACEELAYIETPFSSTSETLMSDKFCPGNYKYLRFYSEVQVGAYYGSRGYFHLCRFQLYPIKAIPKRGIAMFADQASKSPWMDIDSSEDGKVSLLVHSAKTFSAFQMDIVLPEDVEIADVRMAKSSQTRNIGFAYLGNGTWRLLYGTLENKPVSLIDNNLLTIELKSNKPNAGGIVSVENILLTSDNASTVNLNDVHTNLATSIHQMEKEESTVHKAKVYDLSGRLISISSGYPKGVYIINGKKIIR